jgi:polysaccharide biosynthesis protein PslG
MSIARPLVAVIAASAIVAGPAAGADQLPTTGSRVTIGVVPQRDYDDSDTAMMSAAGIDSIRVWLSWSQIEAIRGHYDWSAADAAIRRAAGGGLSSFPFLFTEPDWAVELDGHDCPQCATYAPSSATTRDAYARFAGAAVRRYGPDGTFWKDHPELPYLPIHSWQIWNEQNSPAFFRPEPDPSLYAAMLDSAAREIRGADPDAEVVLGGMFSAGDRSGGTVGSAHYLRELYEVGGVADSFDSIAIHPYARHVRVVFKQIGAMRSVARQVGDGSVGLWVTELGWASRGRHSLGLVTDRAGQARRLKRSFGRLLRESNRLNLRGAFWYAWRDTEHGAAVCSWCPHAGLISRAGYAKPAYDALREVALGADR